MARRDCVLVNIVEFQLVGDFHISTTVNLVYTSGRSAFITDEHIRSQLDALDQSYVGEADQPQQAGPPFEDCKIT